MPELDEMAPDFVVDAILRGREEKISLSGFRGKWVVLFAYPADFTPICETDIIAFARNKARFEERGVQIVGWSVDSSESHVRWISEVKEKSGVEIDYPLIADINKKLAERYRILNKTMGVTYRGVFIVDPDGILKFSAIYALDVGRSIKEVERVIRVLQRARELSHLEELERARELSRYDTQGLLDYPEQLDPLEEAKRIVEAGENKGVMLRLIGGLAIRVHCHGRHSAHLRDYHDIDLFGLSRNHESIGTVFEEVGYSPNAPFNFYHARTRLQFVNKTYSKKVDVFLDKFTMDHTLDFRRRVRLDDFTIPVTDLLITKLQMEKLEEKDMQDIVAILEDHDLGHTDDKETLNVDYMKELCSQDWGLYKTVTDSLQNISQNIENEVLVQCVGMEAAELLEKVNAIRDSLNSSKKTLKWRARRVLGERVKWYKEVEEDTAEA